MMCGLSASAMSAGVALTATGVFSPVGATILLSGSLGMASCVVGLTGLAMSATVGTSFNGFEQALTFTSLGGLSGSVVGAFTGDVQNAYDFAKFGSATENVASGLVGFGLSKTIGEAGFATYELIYGGNSLINESYDDQSEVAFSSGNETSDLGVFFFRDDLTFESYFDSESGSGGQSDSSDHSFGDHVDHDRSGSDDGFDFGGDYDFDFGGDYDFDFGDDW